VSPSLKRGATSSEFEDVVIEPRTSDDPSSELPRASLGLVSAWGAAIIVGLGSMAAYATAPGLGAQAPRSWPAMARVAPDAALPTLVVVVHAYCTCSIATLATLANVLDDAHARLHAVVLFEIPDDVGDVRANPLFEHAHAIAGVEVVRDWGAHDARLFGAHTSGQVLLYLRSGALAFAGGITPARGHQGPSAGRDAILEIVESPSSDATRVTPVFGCPARASR